MRRVLIEIIAHWPFDLQGLLSHRSFGECPSVKPPPYPPVSLLSVLSPDVTF